LRRNPSDRPSLLEIQHDEFFTRPQNNTKTNAAINLPKVKRIPHKFPIDVPSLESLEQLAQNALSISQSATSEDSFRKLPSPADEKSSGLLKGTDLAGKHCKCSLQSDLALENEVTNQLLLDAGAVLGLDMDYCLASYRQHAVNHCSAMWRYSLLRQSNPLKTALQETPDMDSQKSHKTAIGYQTDSILHISNRRLSLQENWQQGRRSVKSKSGISTPPLSFSFSNGPIRAEAISTKTKKSDFTISEEDEDTHLAVSFTKEKQKTTEATRRRSTSALPHLEVSSPDKYQLPKIPLVRSLSVMTNDSALFGTASEGDWSENENTSVEVIVSHPNSLYASGTGIAGSQSISGKLNNARGSQSSKSSANASLTSIFNLERMSPNVNKTDKRLFGR